MKGMLRPKASVLPESALVPDHNLVVPPPNQFTHQIRSSQPYFYQDPNPSDKPDGEFVAGTKVILVRREGESICRVIDERGLYVATASEGLEPLP